MSDIVPYDLEYLRTTNILPTSTRLYTKEQVQVLIMEEREACAKVCEVDHPHTFARHVAEHIRARSNA